MREATPKQLAYLDFLIDRASEEDVLQEAIAEIKPDLRAGEQFRDWIKSVSSRRASEVIDILKNHFLL